MNKSILSRRELLFLAAGASAGILAGGWQTASAQGSSVAGDPGAMFQNPLFAGDYPDVSVLRVGSDFYITHSCDRYAPQLIVWHSTDLVNWRPLSIALDHTYGGVWAPDLIEHEGRFYIYFPLNGSIFAVYTDDPTKSWSPPIDLKTGGIDPGHVVGPDGTRYLFTAGANVVQLAADGLSTVGNSTKVYNGWQYPSDWKTEGFWLESPKFTKRGPYYYMTSAEGGTSGPPTSHMAVVARSLSPLGPWENSPSNPLIHTYSAAEHWWSVGHGTLVSTPDDRWYIIYHGYLNGFQTLGRHTLLEPIEWTDDGWPTAPLAARRSDPMPAPMAIAQRPMIPLSDDFREPVLRATWRPWDESDVSRFQLNKGSLTIIAKGDTAGHSSPLTVSARNTSYVAQVTAAPQSGSNAAFGLFYNPDNWVFIELSGGNAKVYTHNATLASQTWASGKIHMRVVNRNNLADFDVSENGRDWSNLVTAYDVSGFKTQQLGGFLSLRPALAASGPSSVQFSGFKYIALRPETSVL